MAEYPPGALCIVHPGTIGDAAVRFARRARFPYGSDVLDQRSGPQVQEARNTVVREAFEGKEPPA